MMTLSPSQALYKKIIGLFTGLVLLTTPAGAQDLYLVSFTADWCPNCMVLDPAIESALGDVDGNAVDHIVLDMTDAETRGESFDMVNGTVLADVYGDYLGVTGIGIMTAADSGEKIGCVNRTHSAEEIADLLNQAVGIVQTQPALGRSGRLGKCPRANRKIDVW